jgi:hypothetical protein
MVPMLLEELASSVNETFGWDTEWKEVQAFLLARRVLAKLTAWLVFGGSLSKLPILFFETYGRNRDFFIYSKKLNVLLRSRYVIFLFIMKECHCVRCIGHGGSKCI